MSHTFSLLIAASLLAATRTVAGAAGDVPDWEDVSAIFSSRCVMCHSAQGAGLDLRLDSYAAAIAGSRKGVVLIPGDAKSSELIRRLRGESVPRMPFLSRPLPEEELDVILRWVEAGLPEIARR